MLYKEDNSKRMILRQSDILPLRYCPCQHKRRDFLSIYSYVHYWGAQFMRRSLYLRVCGSRQSLALLHKYCSFYFSLQIWALISSDFSILCFSVVQWDIYFSKVAVFFKVEQSKNFKFSTEDSRKEILTGCRIINLEHLVKKQSEI